MENLNKTQYLTDKIFIQSQLLPDYKITEDKTIQICLNSVMGQVKYKGE
jgi:hypothetical protein